MKIKNISQALVVIAGVKIYPDNTVTEDDFGSDFDYEYYRSDFEEALDDNSIIFLNTEEQIITDITEIDEVFDVQDPSNLTPSQNAEDFYYNFKTVSLEYGDAFTMSFQGYLKTFDIFSESGTVEAQIIQPKMNTITVTETNNYVIDTDYKLLNPVVKIKALTACTVRIYLDGIFKHDTKTKEQYLSEIYSDNYFPNDTPINNNELAFKCNFQKNMTNDTFRDVIGNNIGRTYNNATLKNFNKFEDGAYVRFEPVINIQTDEEFTFNMWFKLFENTTVKQYLFYKKDELEIYIYNNYLYVRIDKITIKITPVKKDSQYMFTTTYSGAVTNFYMNNKLVHVYNKRWTFSNNNDKMYFGRSSSGYSLRSAEIGEVNYYKYHLSQGMVRNLYLNNHPDVLINHDLVPGSTGIHYTNTSSLSIDSSYNAEIIKKEVARVDNIVQSDTVNTLSCTTIDNTIKIIQGWVHIPADAKYTFNATFGNEVFFSIDNKSIILNQAVSTYYIEEGYYQFECVANDVFHITYAEKGQTQKELDILMESDNIEYTFNLDDRESKSGIVFDSNVMDLNFIDDVYTSFPVPTAFFEESFTFTMDIELEDGYAQIFNQGALWDEYFSIYASENKIYIRYQNAIFSTSILGDGYNRLDITANGNNIFIYLNGILQEQGDYWTGVKNTRPIFFGMSDGYNKTWISGNFNLKNVKYWTKYSTPNQIINSYKRNV